MLLDENIRNPGSSFPFYPDIRLFRENHQVLCGAQNSLAAKSCLLREILIHFPNKYWYAFQKDSNQILGQNPQWRKKLKQCIWQCKFTWNKLLPLHIAQKGSVEKKRWMTQLGYFWWQFWEEVRLCEEKAVSYPDHSFFLPLLFPPRKDLSVSTYKSQFPVC